MSKRAVTRLFIGGTIVCVAGLALELVAAGAAVAGGVFEIGGKHYVEVNGGAFAWTLVGLVIVGLSAIAAGAIAGVVSWIGALLNTLQLEDKTWFATLLVLGMVSLGTAAMVAYVLAGPDGTSQAGERSASASVDARARARSVIGRNVQVQRGAKGGQ